MFHELQSDILGLYQPYFAKVSQKQSKTATTFTFLTLTPTFFGFPKPSYVRIGYS